MSHIDKSADICYTDISGQKLCYADFGFDSRENGVPFCTKVGGQFPNVANSGKVNFLQNTFGTDYWIALTANVRYVLGEVMLLNVSEIWTDKAR